jgi:CelD/BcsL family acetyltransferase involved in cellulose biosynthesis
MEIAKYHLDSIDRDKWAQLTACSPSTTPFCLLEWLELLEQGFPAWHVHFIVVEQQGRFLAGLPLVVSAAIGVRQSHSMAHGSPAGPLLAPDADPGLASALLSWWADHYCSGWQAIRLSVTFSDEAAPGLDSLRSRDFHVETQTVYRVPLEGRSYEQWESALSQQARNKNRQAAERGGTFERVESQELVPELSRLSKLTAGRHGRDKIPYGETFFRSLLDLNGPLRNNPGLVRVVMVRVKGRPAAYNLCLVYRGRMWLIDHGADSATFAARPNNLIYSRIIRDAFEEGIGEIDLGAVPAEAESLAGFKQGLDGHPHKRHSAVRSNLTFRLAQRAGSLLKIRGGGSSK